MGNRRLLTKRRVVLGLVLLFLSLPFLFSIMVGISSLMEGKQWLYFHSEQHTGRVIDAETNKPIEGAIVITAWTPRPMVREPHPVLIILYINPLSYIGEGLVSIFGGGKNIVAATDKDGRYKIPSWWSFQPWTYMRIGSKEPHFCIYKPGYKPVWTHGDRWIMNGKDLKFATEDLPLTKSLSAKEIEEDYKYYKDYGVFIISNTQEWLKMTNLIEKALVSVPLESRKKIEKDIAYDKQRIHGANK